MAEHRCDKLEMVLYLWAQGSSSSSRCQQQGFVSPPVPALSPGVRVQSGMEEQDVEEQECVFTVWEKWVFHMKAALWLLLMATWQAKTSVFTMGQIIPESRIWMVDSSFELINDFYELLKIILKQFLEFENVPGYFCVHKQSVLLCCLGECLYEDICYLALKLSSHSPPEVKRKGLGRRQDG